MIRWLAITLCLLLPAFLFAAPPLDLRDYGATLNGSGLRDSDAFEYAVADARSGVKGTHDIVFNGALTLTRPTPLMDRVHLWGSDIYGATVLKRWPGGVLFDFRGRRSGGGLHNFSVPQDTGTPGSYTIMARTHGDGAGPHGLQLENLYLGSGTGPGPFRTLELAGTALVPFGIRQVRIHNVTVFGSSSPANVYFAGTVDLFITALRVYPAGGTYGDVVWGPSNTGQVTY